MAAELRRCTLGCGLILDPAAPVHGEMVARDQGGKTERRVQPHCGTESSTCTWCDRCWKRRRDEAKLDEKGTP